jgi:shikimate O-hydroxycinnamoyltransferase
MSKKQAMTHSTTSTRTWVKAGVPSGPHDLTGLDLRVGHTYNACLLVYPQGLDAQALVQSLQKTLQAYPPFTGRLRRDGRNRVYIDASDAGVSFDVFQHAKPLPACDIDHPVNERVKRYMPSVLPWKVVDHAQPLFKVAVHQFSCGGAIMAYGTCHSLADGNATWAFLQDWVRVHQGLPITPPELGRQALIDACNAQRARPYTQQYVLELSLRTRLGLMGRMAWQHFTTMTRWSRRLSRAQVAAWREEARRELGEQAPLPSAHELLMGWCMKALSAQMPGAGDRFLGQVCDMRFRDLPGLPRQYLGNAIGHDLLALQPQALAQASVTQAALMCRMPFERNTPDDLLSYMGLMARHLDTRDNHTLWVKGIVKCLDTGIIFNNCAHFGMYKMDFGSGTPTWFDFDRAPYRMLVLMPTPERNGAFDLQLTARRHEVAALQAAAADWL